MCVMTSLPSVARVTHCPLLPNDCTYSESRIRLTESCTDLGRYLRMLRELIRRFPTQATELLLEAMPVLEADKDRNDASYLLARIGCFYDLSGCAPSDLLFLHCGVASEYFAGESWIVPDAGSGEALSLPYREGQYRFLIVGDLIASVEDPILFCAELQRVAREGYIEVSRGGLQSSCNSLLPKRWNILCSGNSLFFFQNPQWEVAGVAGGRGDVASAVMEQFMPPEWVATLLPTEAYQCLHWEGGFTVEVHWQDGSVSRSAQIAGGRLEELEVLESVPTKEQTGSDHPLSSGPQQVKKTGHRCLFLNTYYEPFLQAAYRNHSELAALDYDRQLAFFQDCQFGDSDFYEKGLKAAGWAASTIIANCSPLQMRWAAEHGLRGGGTWEIVSAQIEHFNPDVVYVQDMHFVPAALVRSLTQRGIVVVGQNASDIRSLDVQPYSLLISSLPPYVDYFRSTGKKSYYQPLAFSESVLSPQSARPYAERSIPLSFVGGISDPAHSSRGQFLVALSQHLPIQMWGYGIDAVSPDSQIRNVYRGEAWGREMFGLLGNSQITVNMHATWFLPAPDGREATLEYANNMRLFEATGMGALLITDYKPRLEQLFRVGDEVVAYRSVDECISLVRYYLDNPLEAAAIASRGQQRTLRDHSYSARMAVTSEWLDRHLAQVEELRNHVPIDIRSISTGYRSIDSNTAQHSCQDAWKDAAIPDKQRSLVVQELEQMYQGSPPRSFLALAEILRGRLFGGESILEVGCSTGYYSEILEYLLSAQFNYTGVDLSPGMIERAQRWYQRGTFLVTQGTELPFSDRSFDVGISGCVLLHDPQYVGQIREICRVSRRYVVAHRTPVSTVAPTQAFHKEGYGVTMVEFRFSEAELLGHFRDHGFTLIQAIVLSQDPASGSGDVSYLFERAD
jgi:SAM-dependent methyltransferase